MEADFQRVLWPVLIAGSVIAAIGVTTLVFIFRAFASKQPTSSHIVLMAALSVFVLLCCVGLFVLAYS